MRRPGLQSLWHGGEMQQRHRVSDGVLRRRRLLQREMHGHVSSVLGSGQRWRSGRHLWSHLVWAGSRGRVHEDRCERMRDDGGMQWGRSVCQIRQWNDLPAQLVFFANEWIFPIHRSKSLLQWILSSAQDHHMRWELRRTRMSRLHDKRRLSEQLVLRRECVQTQALPWRDVHERRGLRERVLCGRCLL